MMSVADTLMHSVVLGLFALVIWEHNLCYYHVIESCLFWTVQFYWCTVVHNPTFLTQSQPSSCDAKAINST